MEINFKIEGLNELEKKLKRLPAEFGKKALQQSLTSAAGKIKRTAQQRAPGSIKEGIFVSKSVRYARGAIQRDTAAAVTVGVFKSGPKGKPHAHLIEYGTQERFVKKRVKQKLGNNFVTLGRRRGRVRARPFLRFAWRTQGKQKFVQRFQKSLEKKIDKYTRG